MAESTPSTGAPATDADAPRLSWREKELVAALKRLAGAQSQVALLEDRLAAQARATAPDPDDARRLEQLEAELVKLRHKANSRFGGSSARDRLGELDMQQRLVLDRLGFASYDAYTEAVASPPEPVEPVDPAFVEFARRELVEAEAAYLEILTLPDADPVVDEPADELDGEDDLEHSIDLTRPEAS